MLQFKRPHVAHRSLWAVHATLVLNHLAHVCGNHVNGDAAGQKRVRFGRSADIRQPGWGVCRLLRMEGASLECSFVVTGIRSYVDVSHHFRAR